MNISTNWTLPRRLVEHPAGHLGEPVVEAGHDAEHRAAEQHVVDVGHDPVGVVEGEVDRHRGAERAVDAADQEHRQEAEREQQSASRSVSLPRHIVKIQLNNFTPVGTAMRNVMRLKNGR